MRGGHSAIFKSKISVISCFNKWSEARMSWIGSYVDLEPKQEGSERRGVSAVANGCDFAEQAARVLAQMRLPGPEQE